jgi:hypothetical protein
VLQNMSGRDGTCVAWASLPLLWMTVIGIVLINIFPPIVTWPRMYARRRMTNG